MMQASQALMYSSASANNIVPNTALMARLGTTNSPLLSQSYANYQNAGYSSALTTDALSQAFFGKSMDQVFSGIDSGSMTKDSMLQQLSGQFGLSTQDSARLLKDISPDLYNTVMGTSKTGETKQDYQKRISTEVERLNDNAKKILNEMKEAREENKKLKDQKRDQYYAEQRANAMRYDWSGSGNLTHAYHKDKNL